MKSKNFDATFFADPTCKGVSFGWKNTMRLKMPDFEEEGGLRVVPLSKVYWYIILKDVYVRVVSKLHLGKAQWRLTKPTDAGPVSYLVEKLGKKLDGILEREPTSVGVWDCVGSQAPNQQARIKELDEVTHDETLYYAAENVWDEDQVVVFHNHSKKSSKRLGFNPGDPKYFKRWKSATVADVINDLEERCFNNDEKEAEDLALEMMLSKEKTISKRWNSRRLAKHKAKINLSVEDGKIVGDTDFGYQINWYTDPKMMGRIFELLGLK